MVYQTGMRFVNIDYCVVRDEIARHVPIALRLNEEHYTEQSPSGNYTLETDVYAVQVALRNWHIAMCAPAKSLPRSNATMSDFSIRGSSGMAWNIYYVPKTSKGKR